MSTSTRTASLLVEDVTVRFGGVVANDRVSIAIEPGRLVGVIGPNGAGKTTLIDAVTGFVPSTGRVELAGQDLTGLDATRRARAGLVRTWQSVELFDDLSVVDNLAVAAHPRRAGDVLRDLLGRSVAVPRERIEAALAAVGAEDLADRFPDELSHGQRKLVGVARGLVADPRVLCLDEPAAGLSDGESRELGGLLRRLAEGGATMLLVDHDMALVLGVCDHVYVMDTGRVIADGPPEAVRNDPRVLDAYLGHRDSGAPA